MSPDSAERNHTAQELCVRLGTNFLKLLSMDLSRKSKQKNKNNLNLFSRNMFPVVSHVANCAVSA